MKYVSERPIIFIILIAFAVGMASKDVVVYHLRATPAHADVGAAVSGNMAKVSEVSIKKPKSSAIEDTYSFRGNTIETALAARELLDKLDAVITSQGMRVAELERDVAILEAEKEILKAQHMVREASLEVKLKECIDK